MSAACLPALRPGLQGLPAYAAPTDRGAFRRLDANEGPSPDLERLSQMLALAAFGLTLYPEYGALRRAAAEAWGLAPAQVMAVNGADEGIALVLRAFTGPGEALLTSDPTFAMYGVYAAQLGTPRIAVPVKEDFCTDVAGLLSALPGARMLALVSPDNPSGRRLDEADLRRLLEAAGDRPVLVDETYAPFCGQDFARLLVEFPNLLVLRTLSKAYGVPGLRCGFLLGDPALIAALEPLRSPYNVNGPAALLGAQLLAGDAGAAGRRQRAVAARRTLQAELDAAGWRTVPSDTHFFLLDLGAQATEVVACLRRQGLLVKDLAGTLPGFLRISVATAEDADAFRAAFAGTGVRP